MGKMSIEEGAALWYPLMERWRETNHRLRLAENQASVKFMNAAARTGPQPSVEELTTLDQLRGEVDNLREQMDAVSRQVFGL